MVVGDRPTATAAISDHCVHVPGDRRAEALGVLRALVRGVELEAGRVEAATGCPTEALQDLARRLKAARYGAFFFGPSMGAGPGGESASEAALKLVRDLNDGRRFIALGLGPPGNAGGAEAVLSWQAGAPSSVDYGMGFPRYLPGEATLSARLEAGEVDAVLIVADDPSAELSGELLARLDQVPTVRIAPGATAPGLRSSVAFDVGRPGIEAGGTVGRVDGVMLPLRPSIASGLPDDRAVFVEILRALGNDR